MNPLITVVVPCYNCQDFVRDTLESVRAQTYSNFECIMVNDAATDGTARILTEFVRRDKRFRVVQHRANSGLGAARNSGIRAAKGEFICFLDSDDLMMATSIQRRLEAILEAGEYDKLAGSYCGSVTILEGVKIAPTEKRNNVLRDVTFLSTLGRCPFNANQPMLRTFVLERTGGFNEYLTQAEDYELWNRLLRAGYEFSAAQWNCVTYRTRQSSMVREKPLQHLEISAALHQSFYGPAPSTSAYTGSPGFYSKAGPSYLYQSHIFNRVCEFAGMAIAKGEKQEVVLDMVERDLPDAFLLFDEDRVRERLLVGVSRYNAGSDEIPETVMSQANDFVTEFQIRAITRNGSSHNPEPSHNPLFLSPFGLLWDAGRQRNIDIIFIPHKDYHVWTISLLERYFQEAGVSIGIIDISCHYRDEGVRSKAKESGIELIRLSNFLLGDFRPRLLVAFNDWEPIVRSLFHCAFAAGIPTLSIVEGIQDYHDVDTGRIREAYLCSDSVVLPGRHDRKYFINPRQDIVIGGVPRILDLMNKKKDDGSKKVRKGTRTKIALINSNFSYGVLTDCRDGWLRDAVEAVTDAGFLPVVSRHPADTGTLYPDLVTDRSFYEIIEEANVVIQRFASGVLEALALEKRVIYFNPHGEKVDKFKNPQGAFRICNDKATLSKALNGRLYGNDRASSNFLDFHCNISDSSMLRNISKHLIDCVKSTERTVTNYGVFFRGMKAIATITRNFTDSKKIYAEFPAIYGARNMLRSEAAYTLEALENGLSQPITILWDSMKSGRPEIADSSSQNAKPHQAPHGNERANFTPSTSTAKANTPTISQVPPRAEIRAGHREKFKRNPYAYFRDSRYPFLRPLRFLYPKPKPH